MEAAFLLRGKLGQDASPSTIRKLASLRELRASGHLQAVPAPTISSQKAQKRLS